MSTYPANRPRGGVNRLWGSADDFTSWLLYGYETWTVAVLKGVSIFLFMYFVLFYISNYAYYLVTVEIPFLRFSEDVGFLIANGIGMGSFTGIIVLLIIPIMAFNLAGGSLWPVRITLPAVGFGLLAAGLGAAALVYLYVEYLRITRRDAEAAARRSAQLAER
jgi:hypothetical protein